VAQVIAVCEGAARFSGVLFLPMAFLLQCQRRRVYGPIRRQRNGIVIHQVFDSARTITTKMPSRKQ